MKPNIASVPALWVLAALVCGCENKPKAPPPGGRPAAPVANVKIYEKPPGNWELLGPVTLGVTAETRWDERGDASRGFQVLKEKVAQMGGNGLLLQADDGTYDVTVLAADQGKYYQVPVRLTPRTAVAKAIYVTP